MKRSLCLSITLTLLIAPCTGALPRLAAEESGAADQPTTENARGDQGDDQAQKRLLAGKAAAQAEMGREGLVRYRANQSNPEPLVAAALAFAEAHRLYELAGDSEAVCDMQANLFWCKKQMNLDAVQAYLKEKGAGATDGLAKVDKIAERKIDVSEADTYLARAEQFAASHQDDPLAVSIRWFEVAERFVGTPAAIKAQKASLAAQEAWQKAERDKAEAARATRFTKPPAVASGQQVPLPDPATHKTALAELKKLWSKDYKKASAAPDKRRLARKLAETAATNKNDSVTYFVMLSESLRLAGETEEYELILDGCTALGAAFTGYDIPTEQRAVLAKMKGKPAAAAIITLLDKPDEPGPNATVGKFFCLDLERWATGLPMLARGDDAEFKKAAELELSNPASPTEQATTGDAWFALAKKASKTSDKNALFSRSLWWYQKALPTIEGIGKERITKRLEELDKALPFDADNANWDNLTPGQWKKIKGQVINVEAKKDRTETGIILKAGESIRVVPHPTETWTIEASYQGLVTCTWKGQSERTRANGRTVIYWDYDLRNTDLPYGSMLVWMDNENDKGRPPGVITGPGQVFLSVNRSGGLFSHGTQKGMIPVKILVLKDD
jgi:hypothetical protein